jgi:ribose transport system substrate-binding protein
MRNKGITKTVKMGIVALLIVCAVTSGAGIYYFALQPATSETGLRIGYSVHFLGGDWHQMVKAYTWWYADDCGDTMLFADCEHDPALQIKQVQYMIAQGIDGLIWTPSDPEATKAIAKLCHDNNIPNITFDEDCYSEYVTLSTSVGVREIARKSAQDLVDELIHFKGEAKGLIFDLEGGLDVPWGVLNNGGLMDVVSNYPDIQVITQTCDWDPAKSKTYLMDMFAKWGAPDIIFHGGFGEQTPGTDSAITDFLGHPNPKIGEEGHIIVGGNCVTPDVIALMKEGRVDQGYTQGEAWVAAGAIWWIKMMKEYGVENVIPPMDTTLTVDSTIMGEKVYPLSETGQNHYGIDPWQYPTWAPATVREEHGHPCVRFPGSSVMPEETGIDALRPDSFMIWGNVLSYIREQGFVQIG